VVGGIPAGATSAALISAVITSAARV